MFPEVIKGQPASSHLQNQTKYGVNLLCCLLYSYNFFRFKKSFQKSKINIKWKLIAFFFPDKMFVAHLIGTKFVWFCKCGPAGWSLMTSGNIYWFIKVLAAKQGLLQNYLTRIQFDLQNFTEVRPGGLELFCFHSSFLSRHGKYLNS